MTATLYLVRHATHDRVGRVLCGRMPGVTLGDEGRHEAARLASRFARERIGFLLTSPLERARETAEIIGDRLGLKAEISDDLNEIDFGEWSGQAFDALDGDPRWRSWNLVRSATRPPGGELMRAAQERIVRCIEQVRREHPDARTILVSHCDVIKAALARYLTLSLDAHSLFEISPASVSALALWAGGAKILSMNEMIPV